MITPQQIYRRARRWYEQYRAGWATGKSYQPLVIPVGSLPNRYIPYEKALEQLCNGARDRRGVGYSIRTKMVKRRDIGRQTIPIKLEFETRDDLLGYLNKREEFEYLQKAAIEICRTIPDLASWVQRWPQKVVENYHDWSTLLLVCQFFLAHPLPALQMRDIPLPCSTKFIERHRHILRSLFESLLPVGAIITAESQFERRYGLQVEEPDLSCRFLDQVLQSQVGSLFEQCTVPLSSLNCLPIKSCQVIVLENKRSFLSLPSLPNTLALWGKGYRATVLRHLSWLADCLLWYWGDLDAQGFEILSSVRSSFPHVRALCMDKATYTKFSPFAIQGTKTVLKSLPCLTPVEHELYTYLQYHVLRLEQERVPIDHVLQYLHMYS